MLLKYTDHFIWKTGAFYTGIVTQEWTSEMVLNLFFKSSSFDLIHK